jgi:uncharacterized protein YbcI
MNNILSTTKKFGYVFILLLLQYHKWDKSKKGEIYLKKETSFNDIIRRVRKELFGKGPERIQTEFFGNKAITMLYGNLTPTEKFIAHTPEGKDIVHIARTRMIQEVYSKHVPDGLEEIVGSKLVHLFSDINIDEDIAISVFVFDSIIQT